MSQLTEQFLAESGKNACVIKYNQLYYTGYYVNWLEKLVEGVRERAPNTASPPCETKRATCTWLTSSGECCSPVKYPKCTAGG